MAQNYGVDIQRWNGQDYDTILPTPDAHASTHQANGSDPLILQTGNYGDKTVTSDKLGDAAVVTSKIANNAVTRDKLANDAKYSPRNMISTANYSIVASDGGKTIISNYTIASSDIVITLSQSASSVMPTDAEIALLWLYGKSFTLAADGVRFAVVGSSTFAIPNIKRTDKFGMISLKKIAPDSKNGDLWLVQGLAEVVS